MIKTVFLSGEEVRVDGVGGFYANVNNLSDDVVYASNRPNITAGADGVAKIPAGAAKLISTAKGAVYLLGIGEVELSGQDYGGMDCNTGTVFAGTVGAAEVTKAYVDARDAFILEEAKEYADGQFEAANNSIAELRSELPSSLPASGGNADTVSGHTVNSDVPENAVFTDTTYSDMQGATESAAGAAGLVPAPLPGEKQRYLDAGGNWSHPFKNITYGVTGLDLNDFKTAGTFYFVAGARAAHRPGSSTSNGSLIVLVGNATFVIQIWFSATAKMFVRIFGTDWTDWQELQSSSAAAVNSHDDAQIQFADEMQLAGFGELAG